MVRKFNLKKQNILLKNRRQVVVIVLLLKDLVNLIVAYQVQILIMWLLSLKSLKM